MRKIICRMCAVCLLLTMLCLTGCGSFMSTDDIIIEEIIGPVVLEDGTTQITIRYMDDVLPVAKISIPKGEKGDVGDIGVGIKNIKAIPDDEKQQTTITVEYTDPDKVKYPNMEFQVPYGVGIVDIKPVLDEVTGATTLTFISSNPSLYSFEPIIIPKGEKGDTGNGIDVAQSTIEPYEKKDEDGNVIEKGKRYTFVFTNGETQAIDIPEPKGIANIEESETEDFYQLTVTYTDGSQETKYFNRPADPNRWYKGANADEILTSLYGKDGDYFFDTAKKEIWSKKDGAWEKIVSFAETKYKVTFDLNDDDAHRASMPEVDYRISSGTCFSANGYDIPIPTRSGYDFCGWYTKKTVDPRIMSSFTDLTTVSSDMTLYAIWEKIETE